jgi:6-phosphogluconolactonase (cycloisomerase 2 family)
MLRGDGGAGARMVRVAAGDGIGPISSDHPGQAIWRVSYRKSAQYLREFTPVQRIPCGGLTPWAFSVHPSGRWLLVANEASSTVNLFGIDQRSGKLTDAGKSISVPNPDSITFCAPAGSAG